MDMLIFYPVMILRVRHADTRVCIQGTMSSSSLELYHCTANSMYSRRRAVPHAPRSFSSCVPYLAWGGGFQQLPQPWRHAAVHHV